MSTPSTIRVSELVGRRVIDGTGRDLGRVLDVGVIQDGPVGTGGSASLRVAHLVVGHAADSDHLGLWRHEVHGPWLLERLSRIGSGHRAIVPWSDLIDVVADLTTGDGTLRLR